MYATTMTIMAMLANSVRERGFRGLGEALPMPPVPTNGIVGAVTHWAEYHVDGGFEDVKHPVFVGIVDDPK